MGLAMLLRPVLAALSAAVFLAATPAPSLGALGDCGQPVSRGAEPSAADALAILNHAVGLPSACAAKPCVCDVRPAAGATALDAVAVLKAAVGQDVDLDCHCDPSTLACTSVEATVLPGSSIDYGWTGLAHDQDLSAGFRLAFDVVRRCVGNDAVCESDQDCAAKGPCLATCDCALDTTCELAGPVGAGRCRTNLAACTTNADCPAGVACSDAFSPPLPFSSGGTPVCVVPFFEQKITGDADVASGGFTLEGMVLRWRIALGIALAQPCPRCGAPEQQPRVGDAFTCEGGQFRGAACTVEAVHPWFGGTSADCAPSISSGVMGWEGPTMRLRALTTGAAAATAKLACSDFRFQSHPSRGNGRCLDDNTVCSSNADCTRCTGDPTIVCEDDADCAGSGSCGEAPDQPVTCGYWCHCGFCSTDSAQDASLPCFQDSDCPSEFPTCKAGIGTGSAANKPQAKPNDCAGDKFLCGLSDEGKCSNTFAGSCSLQPYRNCNDDATCASNGAGTCIIDFRPCFESRITRTGEPSPLASRCEADGGPCSTNADCEVAGDACIAGSMSPVLESTGCTAASLSSAINVSSGVSGPVTLRLEPLLRWCACGDGQVGCAEECDDGNLAAGDGCDSRCRVE